ncbi:MAG: hypothetical protein EZS28_033270, partial [Streblomastix strix]
MDIFSKTDPFVVFQAEDDWVQTTVAKSTLNHEYLNEEYDLVYDPTKMDGKHEIDVEVYDQDSVTKNDLIGTVSVDILPSLNKERQIDLFLQPKKKKKKDSSIFKSDENAVNSDYKLGKVSFAMTYFSEQDWNKKKEEDQLRKKQEEDSPTKAKQTEEQQKQQQQEKSRKKKEIQNQQDQKNQNLLLKSVKNQNALLAQKNQTDQDKKKQIKKRQSLIKIPSMEQKKEINNKPQQLKKSASEVKSPTKLDYNKRQQKQVTVQQQKGVEKDKDAEKRRKEKKKEDEKEDENEYIEKLKNRRSKVSNQSSYNNDDQDYRRYKQDSGVFEGEEDDDEASGDLDDQEDDEDQIPYEKGFVKINNISVRNVSKLAIGGKADPYVIFKVGEKQRQTSIAPKTYNYNYKFEKFAFPFNPFKNNSPREVKVEVWDYNNYGRNDLIGTASAEILPSFNNKQHIDMFIQPTKQRKDDLSKSLTKNSTNSSLHDQDYKLGKIVFTMVYITEEEQRKQRQEEEEKKIQNGQTSVYQRLEQEWLMYDQEKKRNQQLQQQLQEQQQQQQQQQQQEEKGDDKDKQKNNNQVSNVNVKNANQDRLEKTYPNISQHSSEMTQQKAPLNKTLNLDHQGKQKIDTQKKNPYDQTTNNLYDKYTISPELEKDISIEQERLN